MKTLKSILLTLLIVILVFGGSFLVTFWLRDQGIIGGGEAIEEVDDEDVGDEESVYPFIIPTDGPEVAAAKLSFSYKGKSYEVQPVVDSRVYHGAVAAPRGYHIRVDADEQTRFDALRDYYNKLTYDPEMEPAIESVREVLRGIRDEAGLDSDEYIELMAKYVQSIPYDETRGLVNVESAEPGDPRMPIQVLVDGVGDCDEKVMLLATLLTHEGIDAQAFFYKEEKHMALGVSSEGAGFHESGFEYIETTALAYVSEFPQEFAGGVTLRSAPQDFPFGEGGAAGFYSSKAVAQVERIVRVRDSAEAAAEKKKREIESGTWTEAEFQRQEAMYQACFTALNTFRATVDSEGNSTNDFKDRPKAIAWIDKNAWWE